MAIELEMPTGVPLNVGPAMEGGEEGSNKCTASSRSDRKAAKAAKRAAKKAGKKSLPEISHKATPVSSLSALRDKMA
jgi:hypothetical protein